MRATCGGVVVYDDSRPTLIGKLDEVCKDIEERVGKYNRETRRHKITKKIMTLFGTLSVLAYTAVAHAEEVSPDITQTPIPEKGFPERVGGAIVDRLIEHYSGGNHESGEQSASIYWQLNKLATDTVFINQDFFHNPDLVGMFTTVALTAMSLTTLVIAKKGLDMIKSSVMGGSTMGVGELFLRLFASVILTYLILPSMSYGVKLSNALIQTVMGHFVNGSIPMSVSTTTFVGETFWLVAFFVLLTILLLQYWVRQIQLIVLGIFAPVATTAWVADDGAMARTLIQETIIHLATPWVQGGIMAIGTAVVTSILGHQGVDPINAIFASIATIFVMITVPSFLRKFTTGSINPFKWAINMAVGVKKLPMQFMPLVK